MTESPLQSAESELEFYASCVDRFLDFSTPSLLDFRDGSKERFNSHEIRDLLSRFTSDVKQGRRSCSFNLYVGIPYCADTCNFCTFFPEKLQSREQLREYLQNLDDSLQYFAGTFSELPLASLLVGGGTPSLLSAEQLQSHFGSLFERFQFLEDGEKHFEVHPASCSEEKLQIIKRLGFNTVTIGVQSFTDEVLRVCNRRGQTAENARRAIVDAKRLAFRYGTNVDLMLGLQGDDPESFLRSFRATAELQPDKITVWVLKPVTEHMAWHFEETMELFDQIHDGATVHPLVEQMFSVARQLGYRERRAHPLNFTYEFRLGPETPHPGYSSMGRAGTSTIGFGSMARSNIPGVLSYLRDPLVGKFDPADPVYSGYRVEPRFEMLQYLFFCIAEQSSLSRARFEAQFGRPLLECFGPALERLTHLKAIESHGDRVRFLERDDRRRLAHFFFFLGKSTLRQLLDAYASPVNQIKLSLDDAELGVWIERVRSDQKYVARSGDYGLQINASGRPVDARLNALLILLFAELDPLFASQSGPERTYVLHRELEGRLRALGVSRLKLKPWMLANVKSGFAYPVDISSASPEASLGLRIEITRNCMLRCRYCFIDDASPQSFEDELVEPLVRFLGGTGRRWRLDITGGEPLLVFQTIWRLLERCREQGVVIEGGDLTTNGVLADTSKIDYLAANDFSLIFSLDGPEEVHLKNRTSRASKINSHEKVVTAVRYMRSRGYPYGFSGVFHGNTVAALDRSVEFLVGLADNPQRVVLHPSMGRALDPEEFRLLDRALERLVERNPEKLSLYRDILCQTEQDFLCQSIYLDCQGALFPTCLFANKQLEGTRIHLNDVVDPRATLSELLEDQRRVSEWNFDEELRDYEAIVQHINDFFARAVR